ncbi:glycosyltransferase [Vibrio europaeus]|uniref:glycosyltransferase n=1 Tax=Vibrio europaeus TaxID=300876 RepID=UPI00234092DC|nr:glycosyltransferase [Vibrio europaeus]MDC5850453.1 glycosyltransferase [Vibrio europaeus]
MVCWLANSLTSHGYKVLLLSLDDSGASSFYSLDPAVEWVRLGKLSQYNRTRQQLAIFKQFGVECLIAFVASGDRTLYVSAKLAGAKIVIAERNAPSMYKIRFSLLQRLMSFSLMHLADRITVQQREFIADYPSTLRSRSRCIPNPVNIPITYSKPMVSINGRYSILTVSRLDGVQKGIPHLIHAFKLVCDAFPDWDVVIVGAGPQLDYLKRLVEEQELSSRVIFAGEMSEVSHYYLRAHLFVIPSLWEGFPNALAEAMSYGLPSIGFEEAKGVSSLISDKVGWLASGLENPYSLAESMSIAMSSPIDRADKGACARQKMYNYKPDVQILFWAKLIEEI